MKNLCLNENYILEQPDIFKEYNGDYILFECEKDMGIYKNGDILLLGAPNKFNGEKVDLTFLNTQFKTGVILGYIRDNEVNIIQKTRA